MMTKLQVYRDGQWHYVQGYVPGAGIVLAETPQTATPSIDEKAQEAINIFQQRFPLELFKLSTGSDALSGVGHV